MAQVGQKKNSLSSSVLLVAVRTGTIVDPAWIAFSGRTCMVVGGVWAWRMWCLWMSCGIRWILSKREFQG